MTEAKEYWEQYEEEAAVEITAGRGGAIARVQVETGWKGFANGASNDSTWFPASRGTKEWKTAQKAAREVCDDGRFPSSGLNIRADKNRYYVQGQPRTYDDDRHFFRSDFHELAKGEDAQGVPRGHKVLIPALKAVGVVAGWEGWARLAWVPNPYYLAQGDEEKARDKSVVVISEVFENETAAMKAVSEMPTGEIGEGLDVPDGFDEADWDNLVNETGGILDLLKGHIDKGKSETVAATLVAKDVGIEVRYVTPLLKEIVPV